MLEIVKNKVVVDIDEEEARLIERLWYEYNGSRDIIKFLMTDKSVVWEVLQEYINVAEKRFTELEMEKNRVATKYKPEQVDLSKWNYSFDFTEDQITFEEA